MQSTSSIRIDSHVSRDQSDHSGQSEHLLKRQNWPLSSWRKNQHNNIILTPSEQAYSNQGTQ